VVDYEEKMKVIDSSPSTVNVDHLSIIHRLRGSISHGLSWVAEVEAQQSCADRLGKVLGAEYTLFRNFPLKDLDIEIPLVLVGPAGLFVIQITTMTGSFRATDNDWLSIENARKPKPVQPNLVVRMVLLARAFDVYLAKNGIIAPAAQPLLLCSNPHMFVECVHTPIRVMIADSLELFAASLKDVPVGVAPQVVDQLVTSFSPNLTGEASPESKVTPIAIPAAQEQINLLKESHPRKLKFTRGQLVVLCIIIVFEIAALAIVLLLTLKAL
jgi:hypothetical protein